SETESSPTLSRPFKIESNLTLLHPSQCLADSVAKTGLDQSSPRASQYSTLSGKDREKEKARREKSLTKGSESSLGRKGTTYTATPMAPKTSNITYFKCLGKGHIAFQCSNRRVMIVNEAKSFSYGFHYEGDFLVVRRLMKIHIGEEAKTQRENIFHSRCLILDNLCSMIIDGGELLVKKLALPIFVQLRPHKLQRLSERRELLVDKQVKVIFTLRGYEDKVVCDVVPMEATHLLLGRPWQYNKKVIHDGVTNRFTFVHLGQRFMLKPLSPRVVHEDQKKIKVKRKVDKNIESKLKKKRNGE
ncbi:hypothetical protein CR513_36786, partial [Mucuna pruriens]